MNHITSIGNICTLQNGRAFKPEEWSESGIPIVRIQNLNDETKPFNYCKLTIDKKFHVQSGDLLFSWSGTPGTSFGAFFWNRGKGFLNQHIFRVETNDALVWKPYLKLALNSQLNTIIGHAHGGVGLQHITKGKLESVEIFLPPIAEQRRIAAILDQADALRAKRRETLAELDGLAQAIFLEMFGDPIVNPKKWLLQAFGQVCDTRLGKMLDQKQQTGEHRRPYLRNANVQWHRFELSDVSEMDFDDDAKAIFSLRPGDILICEGGEPGRSAIWQGEIKECYYQKALHRARPKEGALLAEYLVWLLWFLSKRGGLSDHVTSATIAHLTGEKLKAMKIMVPPLAVQKTFASRIIALESLKATHRTALTELDALFASLQHRAFRGEL